ncbi:hypothetical protein NQ317_006348 [Molorchus minor]|uniref:Uncharacterized protein n=1 Tax=Molorchus minor TaxID=1323400 RepID=A0ABQ9JLT4_9CUCU|nr:hypothetical protein NQ317_006348 [Molorchus minor]
MFLSTKSSPPDRTRSQTWFYTTHSLPNKKEKKQIFFANYVFIKLLPCIILTIITCWLIKTLFMAKRRKQVLRGYDSYPLTNNGKDGKDMFLVCYQKYGEVMDIMALLNGSINFILYCCMNRMFRTTFGQLFKHKILARWTSSSPSEIHTMHYTCNCTRSEKLITCLGLLGSTGYLRIPLFEQYCDVEILILKMKLHFLCWLANLKKNAAIKILQGIKIR